jgi:histidine ammonia-lyase
MLTLTGEPLTLDQITAVAEGSEVVDVSEAARERMRASRKVIVDIVARGETVYGVNTGFGKLSEIHIPPEEIKQLQLNLIRSHACGVGNPLSIPETRALMLLRANVLATGYSGARPEVLDALVTMINESRHPVIPEKGSVGASGDLAPLAHLALALIGEAPVHGGGLAKSVSLEAKEGLVLINGTQAMGAVGSLALRRARTLLVQADRIGAMALEALLGTDSAFDPRIHAARRHGGQIEVANHLIELLAGSQIRESHRVGDTRVQDAYSLRCMPQVHGAVRDAISFAIGVVETESGAATDNPLVFSETGDVISGGNFHGSPLALAFDFAAIALVHLMSMSERRIDRLVNPDLNEGLPPFLARHAGSSSGLMIPHVVAVALLNESRVLAHPSSVDNTPTSGGKEDHVSMGMTGALKLRTIVENLSRVLAIEAISAAEGIEFRRPLRSGAGVEALFAQVRETCPALVEDRSLSAEIEALAVALQS